MTTRRNVLLKPDPPTLSLLVAQTNRVCVCDPPQGKNAFFRDLTTIQLMPSGDMDPGLVSLRQEVSGVFPPGGDDLESPGFVVISFRLLHVPALPQFLLRLLTAWVQAIQDPSSSAPATKSPPVPSGGPTADWWPSLCLELGSLMQVNPDILRRHIVCELYNQGLDLRAEEVRGKLFVVNRSSNLSFTIHPIGHSDPTCHSCPR